MSYKTEFRSNWVNLLAAAIGISFGLTFSQYVMSLFAPGMIAEFGWTKAQFALIGSTSFISMLFIPLAGRFTDRVGSANAATIGFVMLPLCYFALSMMTGSFALFFVLTLVKSVCGSLTTSMVFARVAVERFEHARGLALSIVMTGPPAMGALAVPLVAEVISDHGWRDGFRALGVVCGIGGLFAAVLLRRGQPSAEHRRGHEPFARRDLLALLRSRVLLYVAGGMFLVNLPQGMVGSQLKLVLQDGGARDELGTLAVSLYAIGVAGGRFLCGLALDRIPAHKVALVALGLPALGFGILASPLDSPAAVICAVLIVGLAQGAEGDVAAYVVSRQFPTRNYSMILGLVTVALTLGVASGSILLSRTLHTTGSYDTFMWICAAGTIVGAVLFYLSGRTAGDPQSDDGECAVA